MQRKCNHGITIKDTHNFINALYDEDIHAKRIESLANATIGVVGGGALAINTIGHGLALAKGTQGAASGLRLYKVNGVERMLYMSSTCASDGSYALTVTFDVGTNLDMAQVLVQNRVTLALPVIPPLGSDGEGSTYRLNSDAVAVTETGSPGKIEAGLAEHARVTCVAVSKEPM